jgi:hypothetical protein
MDNSFFSNTKRRDIPENKKHSAVFAFIGSPPGIMLLNISISKNQPVRVIIPTAAVIMLKVFDIDGFIV